MSDAIILKNVLKKAVSKMYLDEAAIYKLIEVLPRIIPAVIDNSSMKPENQDWNDYIDEHRARYKHEMERLLQILSNWVFMESAVHRKNMEPLKRHNEKENLNHIGKGMKK